MAVAVFWDNLQLPWLPAILRGILPNLMIKSSQVSFGDLISACTGSLCNLSIWRDLSFKIFHHVRGQYHSYLHLSQTEWEVHCMFFQRQVETHCLSIGFEAMEISFKSESLTILSDSKRYNCLRRVHFATHLTPLLSKISAIFSVSHKLWIFFNIWT